MSCPVYACWYVCLLLVVRLLLFNVLLVASFNIDVSVPLVKRGASDSYFGFSAVPHKIRQTTSNDSRPVLLVGAPKDNVTHRLASDVVRRTVRPGSVYSCPLTLDPTDCTQLAIAIEDPEENEDRSDQWMGGTVASQTSDDATAIVCAHRYKRWGVSFRWGLGWCISLTNSLEEDRFWEPCAGKPKGKGHGEYGFCQAGTSAAISPDGEIILGAPGPFNWRGAIFTNSLHDVFQTWHQSPVEDGRPSREDRNGPTAGGRDGGAEGVHRRPATAYYSYLGMSVQIGRLLPGAKTTYVAGAPRSSFAGQVLLFQMTTSSSEEDGRDSGGGDGELTTDPSQYLTGEQFGSGFGHSVAVADFNGDGRDDLVVGAPFFFLHPSLPRHHPPSPPPIVDSSASSATSASFVGGAVYVYINSHQGIRSESRSIRLFGRKTKESECLEWRCHDARFGLALAAIGDTDLDGYQDLLVGAPYEGGVGAIYVFRGSSSGMSVLPSQRISASHLPSFPLHSFGASVSGGVDLDLNGYPDVVIGAYSSDAVVVLWSRPVVDILVSVGHWPALIDPRLTNCPLDQIQLNCFQINICFTFNRRSQQRLRTTTSSLNPDPLDIDFSLQPDRTNDVPGRILFSSSTKSSSSASSSSSAFVSSETLNASVQLEKDSSAKCSNVTVYVAQSNRDFLNPLKLILTYKLSDEQRPTTTSSSSSSTTTTSETESVDPILKEILSNADEALSVGIEHSVDFVKNCGDDSKCEANLKVQGVLQVDRDEIGQYILRAGEEPELRVFVRIANRQEDAHETILTVLVPHFLKYRGTNTEGRPYSCSPTTDGGAIHCAIGNPLPSDEETFFALRLDASSVDYSVDEFEIILLVNTTSVEIDEEDNQDVLKVKVVLETDLFVKGSSDPLEVFYGGETVGESATRHLEDIGPTVKHSYEVKNVGKSKVPNVRVQISWPYEIESGYPMGKHLLYLTDHPQVNDESRTRCHVDDDSHINPLQLQNRTTFDPRTRNTTTDDRGPEVVRRDRRAYDHVTDQKQEAMTSRELVDGKKHTAGAVQLDCDLGTAKCHLIHCSIDFIEPGDSVVISVLSRLWRSTFIEDFRKFDHVTISSKAEIEIELNDKIRQLNPVNATEKATTIALPDIGIQEVRSVPLWILIASVTAGVLFLCLFIFILWKCGFFRRKRGVNMEHKAVVKKSECHYDLLQNSAVTMTPRPGL